MADGAVEAVDGAGGDGARFRSDAMALTHTKPISANKNRVEFITYPRIDESRRNEAKAVR